MKNIIFSIIVLLFSYLEIVSQNPYTYSSKTQSHIRNDKNDSELFLHGHWPDGSCKASDVQNNICIIGTGSAVDIMDISAPATPLIVSRYVSLYPVFQIEINNNIAFIGSGNFHIQALDISDPYNPVELGFATHPNNLREFSISGNYLYSINYWQFRIWNFSDPQNPVLESYLPCPNNMMFYGISISNDFAYMAVGLSGMAIYNVENPSNPIQVSTVDFEGYSVHVCSEGNYVYCANEEWGIRVIDVTDPNTPNIIGLITGLYATHVYDKDGLLHATSGASIRAYYLIDVADPYNPFIYDMEYLGSEGSAIHNYEYYTYISFNDGFSIFNISNPYNINLINFLNTPDMSMDIVVKEEIAYVLEYYDGLWILDVSQPDKPKEISSFSSEGYSSQLYLYNDCIYIANSIGLYIINVEDPDMPYLECYYQTEKHVLDVYVNDSIAYLANSSDGLIMLDVSNPAIPEL
ncbi:MAG: hypothetical protein K8R86_12875, partial [Bacteroidales bacterium]|nr:hypothetical protein [Bacteroidales bacterium]